MKIFNKRSTASASAAERSEGGLSLYLPDMNQRNLNYRLEINKAYEALTGERTGAYEKEDYFEIRIYGAYVDRLYSEDWEKHLGRYSEDDTETNPPMWQGDRAEIEINPVLIPDDFERRQTSGEIGQGWRKNDGSHLIKLYLTNEEIRNVLRIMETPYKAQEMDLNESVVAWVEAMGVEVEEDNYFRKNTGLKSMNLGLFGMSEPKQSSPLLDIEVGYFISGIRL